MSAAMLAAQQSTLSTLPAPAPAPPPIVPVIPVIDDSQQNEFSNNRGLIAMSDMKKRLEAFKVAKTVDAKLKEKQKQKAKEEKLQSKRCEEEKNQRKSVKSPEIIEVDDCSKTVDSSDSEEEKTLSPLMLLRKYTIKKLLVGVTRDQIAFNTRSFPTECRTNLKINRPSGSGPDEFYTLGCLVYFLQNMTVDHPEYVRRCISANVKCVRRPDRKNVKQFLCGEKDFVLNLESLSHRELNPKLFGDPVRQPAPSSSGVDGVERTREREEYVYSRERRMFSEERGECGGERRRRYGGETSEYGGEYGSSRRRSPFSAERDGFDQRRKRQRTESGESGRQSYSRSPGNAGAGEHYLPSDGRVGTGYQPSLRAGAGSAAGEPYIPSQPTVSPPQFRQPAENGDQRKPKSRFDQAPQPRNMMQGNPALIGNRELTQHQVNTEGYLPGYQGYQANNSLDFQQEPFRLPRLGPSPFDQRPNTGSYQGDQLSRQTSHGFDQRNNFVHDSRAGHTEIGHSFGREIEEENNGRDFRSGEQFNGDLRLQGMANQAEGIYGENQPFNGGRGLTQQRPAMFGKNISQSQLQLTEQLRFNRNELPAKVPGHSSSFNFMEPGNMEEYDQTSIEPSSGGGQQDWQREDEEQGGVEETEVKQSSRASLGPMFVIGSSSQPPPGRARRW